MSTYEFKPFRPELLEHAAELARRQRGGTLEEQIAYYDWKYLRNPYITEPIVHMALRRGRAVGLRAFYGTCWESGVGGQRYVFPAASDSAVLDEHRGEDVYRRLGEAMLGDAASRGFTHVLNLSASPQTALTAILTFGWKGVVPREVMATPAQGSAADVLRQRLPAPIRAFVRKARGRLRRAVGHRSSTFAALDRSEPRISRGVETRVTPSTAELADMARRTGGDERLQLVRDEEFYRWRFSNPGAEYRFLVAEDRERKACGYLVLRKKELPTVFMLDWQGTSATVREELLVTAISRGQLTALSTWSASLSPEELAMLGNHGFVQVAPGGAERWRKSLLVRPVGDPGDDENWVLDEMRLDTASSWNVRATGSDFY